MPHAIREKIATDACARHIEPDHGAPASPDFEWIIGAWSLQTGDYIPGAHRAFEDADRQAAHAYASRRTLKSAIIQYIAIRVRRYD